SISQASKLLKKARLGFETCKRVTKATGFSLSIKYQKHRVIKYHISDSPAFPSKSN
ncbi:unnamed protein product, partial [Dovyalis caffra]